MRRRRIEQILKIRKVKVDGQLDDVSKRNSGVEVENRNYW